MFWTTDSLRITSLAHWSTLDQTADLRSASSQLPCSIGSSFSRNRRAKRWEQTRLCWSSWKDTVLEELVRSQQASTLVDNGQGRRKA